MLLVLLLVWWCVRTVLYQGGNMCSLCQRNDYGTPGEQGVACVGSDDGAGERQLICLTHPAASLLL